MARFPVDVAAQAIEVLRTRHVEWLAAVERAEGIPARTLPHMTVDHLTGEGARTRVDKPRDGALALVGLFTSAQPPEATKRATLTFTWTLAMEVITRGVGREDTIRRRDWYGLTAAECLASLMPRTIVSRFDLIDADMAADAPDDVTADTLAVARFMWDVEVPDSLSLVPMFTNPPADPYDIPESFPPPPNVVRTRVIKEPL